MELGELELAVLRAVRNLGPATSGAIYAEVRKTRDVAYTRRAVRTGKRWPR